MKLLRNDMNWSIILYSFLLLVMSHSIIGQTTNTIGLKLNTEQSYNGYTLYAPVNSKNTYLIDNCGYEVHRWNSNYNPALSAYITNRGTLIRPVRINTNFSAGGSGGLIEEYDWEGNLIWSTQYSSSNFCQHHEVYPMDNGNLLVLAWEYIAPIQAIQMGRVPTLITNEGIWTETVVEIKPIGASDYEVVWEWHLKDHLIQDFDSTRDNFGVVADHPELLDINYAQGQDKVDIIHANAIDYNSEFDQILINSRNYNEFYIIDHSTSTAEAASSQGGNSGKGGDILYRYGNPATYDRGTVSDQKFFLQHGARWINNLASEYHNQIIVFNNGVERPQGNFSSVEIVDPPYSNGQYIIENNEKFGPESFSFAYVGSPTSSFFSSRISSASMLPNENILIVDGQKGRMFEINQAKEIVWEYINPVVGNVALSQGNFNPESDVFSIDRYGEDHQAFDGLVLTPGNPVESFSDYDCTIFQNTVSTTDHIKTNGISLLQNPIGEYISIINPLEDQLKITIYALDGTLMNKAIVCDLAKIEFDISLQSGYYILNILDVKTNMITNIKMIKL